jgi:hypothetical protein
MKNTYPWTKYFIVLMLVAAPTTLLAQEQEIISGEYTHSFEDYFDEGKTKSIHQIIDEKTSRIHDLNFPNGQIPESLQAITSGSKIRVKGKKNKDGSSLDVMADEGAIAMDTVTYPTGSLRSTRKVLAVRVNFLDSNAVCTDESTTFKYLFDLSNPQSVKNFYRTNSDNTFDLAGEIATVRISLNVSQATTCDYNGIRTLANDQLVAAGYNLSLYQHKMYFLPQNLTACSWAGLGNVNGGNSWIKSCNYKTMAHELGHNFGLYHAADSGYEYGDASCSMGSGYREFNAPHKNQLGWVPNEKSLVVTSSGTYRLSPFNENPTLAAYPQIIKIPNTTVTGHTFLSYRSATGEFDTALSTTYANRLNITLGKSNNSTSMFLNALGDGGSYSMSGPDLVIKNVARTASYIEVQISAGSGVPTDTTLPNVSLISPVTGSSYLLNSTVTAEASASDNVGVSHVEFYVGGSLKCTDSTSPYTCAFVMPSGTSISVRARAYDAAGNFKDSTYSYISSITPADTTPPSVTLTSPSNGSSFVEGATVSATATASDNVGVTKVEFYINNSLKCSDTTASYSCSFAMPSGTSISVRARAHDAAGNFKDSVISYISSTAAPVDTTPPSVPQGLTLSIKRKSDVTVSFNPSSDNVGVTGYEILRDGQLIATSTSTSYTDQKLAKGEYSYQVRALDKTGNKSALSAAQAIVIPR